MSDDIDNEEEPDESPPTIEEASAEALELLEEIRAGQESANTILEQCRKDASEIDDFLESSKTADEAIDEYLSSTAKSHISIDADETAIQKLKVQARADYEEISGLSLKAAALEKTVTTNMEKLDSLSSANEALKTKVESLLPGATSVGLAKAFMDRKNEFKWPRRLWTVAALVPILLIIPVGLLGAKGFLEIVNLGTFNWEIVVEGLLLRLPVAGPLVWLAIYAGRHHVLTSRLEEDYAYKEVMSRSFEGYKREFENIAANDESADGLKILCSSVLTTMGQPPGRLFDKKHKDSTPLNAMVEALDDHTVGKVSVATGVESGIVEKVLGAFVRLFR